MRINIPFVQGEFTADYQGVAKDQFLADKKLGVCWQEVNFLSTNSQLLVKGEIAIFSVSLHSVVDSTNGLCVQSSVLERLNAFLSSCLV